MRTSEVRADDPGLSPETNARLTAELRDVVGADRARVPRDRPRASDNGRRALSSRRSRGAIAVAVFWAVVALAFQH